MSVYVLGISAFYHDSAAALLRDGEIVAAVQEERFTRKKGDARFPTCALQYCLDTAQIGAAQLKHIVFYENPFVKYERLLETYLAFAPQGVRSFAHSFPMVARHRLHIPEHIRFLDGDGGPMTAGRVLFTDHHDAHAASAFYPSPFDEAAAAIRARGYVPHVRQRGERPPPPARRRNPARRWVVEQTLSWLNRFRKLLVRFEKRVQSYEGLLESACALIASGLTNLPQGSISPILLRWSSFPLACSVGTFPYGGITSRLFHMEAACTVVAPPPSSLVLFGIM